MSAPATHPNQFAIIYINCLAVALIEGFRGGRLPPGVIAKELTAGQ